MGAVSEYSGHSFTRADNDSFAHLFEFVPEKARVLDVGCSTGNFGASLASGKGCDVVGIDLNAADIDVAKQKFPNAFVLDITATDSLATLGKFDVIVFADVLEHLVDPRDTLRRVKSALVPGGRVLFSIPNMAHLSIRLGLLAGQFPYTPTGILDNTHLHFYDRDEVEALFSDAGFRITDEKPVVLAYPPSWVSERLAEVGLTAGKQFSKVVEDTEADIFQFVGAAFPTEASSKPQVTLRNRTFPHSEIREHANAALARATESDARAKLSEARLAEAERRTHSAQQSLADLHRSTSWRITAPIRAVSRLFRR